MRERKADRVLIKWTNNVWRQWHGLAADRLRPPTVGSGRETTPGIVRHGHRSGGQFHPHPSQHQHHHFGCKGSALLSLRWWALRRRARRRTRPAVGEQCQEEDWRERERAEIRDRFARSGTIRVSIDLRVVDRGRRGRPKVATPVYFGVGRHENSVTTRSSRAPPLLQGTRLRRSGASPCAPVAHAHSSNSRARCTRTGNPGTCPPGSSSPSSARALPDSCATRAPNTWILPYGPLSCRVDLDACHVSSSAPTVPHPHATAFSLLRAILLTPKPAPTESLSAPVDPHAFIQSLHTPRIYKVYLQELSDVCRDYFWDFCHPKNTIWKLGDVDINLVETPKAPSGMTGGVEYEAMGYLVRRDSLQWH